MRCLSKEEYAEISARCDGAGEFWSIDGTNPNLEWEYENYLKGGYCPVIWIAFTEPFLNRIYKFCLLLEEAEKLKMMEETLKAIDVNNV